MIDAARGAPMLPDVFRVERVRRETADTVTVVLASDRWPEGWPFEAGQFNMLYVHGIGEVPVSISGDPGVRAPLVHTVREVGAVSAAIRALKPGDQVGVRGPYGVGWPLEHADGCDVVLAAGGIGLAPLRPAVYRLLANRDRYGKVVILYGTRTPADILFKREIEAWRARLDVEVYVTVDRAAPGWHGDVGVVSRLIARAPIGAERSLALICGPEIMMRFVALELEKRGVAGDRIYVSMERNMKCGIGLCGHCQCGTVFVCKDGPVFRYDRVRRLLSQREM